MKALFRVIQPIEENIPPMDGVEGLHYPRNGEHMDGGFSCIGFVRPHGPCIVQLDASPAVLAAADGPKCRWLEDVVEGSPEVPVVDWPPVVGRPVAEIQAALNECGVHDHEYRAAGGRGHDPKAKRAE